MYKIKEILALDTNCTILENRVRKVPNQRLVAYKTQSGSWVDMTAKTFQKYVISIAKGLTAVGIKKGDKIGIMSKTSFAWVVLDFAAWTLGAVTVPIYETSSSHQIEFICNDAEIKLLFVENHQIQTLVNLVKEKLKTVKTIRNLEKNVLDELETIGRSIKDSEIRKIQAKNKSTDIATIVYTSGSTGKHKGVEVQHKAFLSIVYSANEGLPELVQAPNTSILLFLPLAHIFARFAVLAVIEGASLLALSGDISNLLNDMRYIKPNYIIGVPRIFEKVYNAASQKAGPGIKGKIFKDAAKTAIEYSKSLDKNNSLQNITNPKLLTKKILYDNLIFKQIRSVLGNNMKWAVCGGAALDPNIAHFFRGAGIEILEGYGLTEITAPAMCNRPGSNKIGTIGLPFSGVETKIAQDGELIIKTPSVFSGYHNDSENTKKVLRDGWFWTGDLAEQDSEGFIKLIGRKKDIIVTAGGKNVSPIALEQIIQSSDLVSHCVVIGDKKPFVAALITLDMGAVDVWAQKTKIRKLNSLEASKNKAIKAVIQRSIDEANETVSRAESVRKFVILPDEFTVKNSCLTASQKMIRQNILDKYKTIIDNGIYKK
ncbi:MAG: AMP-dependent synthetase/ligase [Bifidobacteriaceae bacterium]|jgi:long-chain acyl-CoA synthetase|nr:AMP-dependent synthetase/ligase [Bifidobacteriaceae bacterium]